jgi:hypothetical protein
MAGRIRLLIGGTVAYAGAAGGTYYYNVIHKSSHPLEDNDKKPIAIEDTHRQKTYATIAPGYDQRKRSFILCK